MLCFQFANGAKKDTYLYEHLTKNSVEEYVCHYEFCRQYIQGINRYQSDALVFWSKTVQQFKYESEIVQLFGRLEDMFHMARTYKCQSCVQDFDIVLTAQKMAYDHVFEVCAVEGTNDNLVNYRLNMSSIRRAIQLIDLNTYYAFVRCEGDNTCQHEKLTAGDNELQTVETHSVRKIDWLEKKLIFDNINSVKECLQIKTEEQVQDLKKIIATVEQCISYLMTPT